MIFLIIGCDATGKTTLAERLSALFDMPIIHLGPPSEKESAQSRFNDLKKLFIEKDNFIMDRSFYCEMIYGPLLRQHSEITWDKKFELEDLLSRKNAVVIYCYEDPSVIGARFDKTKESFISKKLIPDILEAYEALLSHIPLPILRYRIGGPIFASLVYVYSNLAEGLAAQSTCLERHVGAVITSRDLTQIYSIGYNGNASGLENKCDGKDHRGGCGCVHAEINALIKCCTDDKNKIMFLTLSPCQACAKAIINSGVSVVYYLEEWKDKEGLELLQTADIRTTKIEFEQLR